MKLSKKEIDILKAYHKANADTKKSVDTILKLPSDEYKTYRLNFTLYGTPATLIFDDFDKALENLDSFMKNKNASEFELVEENHLIFKGEEK